ncbi:hypothetical protein BASA60_001349 [Batrachochytrium salamandrivorans]|nr:hypothetical protein BASA60_001349 [Batrachochytrium salamandrivorans]
MQVANNNDVKIYSITSASRSAIPDWAVRKNKDKLKHDQAWRSRIELIQDFEFPEASLRIQATRDGNYIMATGVYQPQMRVFELGQMAMKFDRHTDAENVQFEILSDDWTKSVLLQSDRTIELHSQFGLHYKMRVPKFGRDLSYHYPSCDLMVVGSSNEVWRLNLEQGRFLTSLQTDMAAINVSSISPAHQLMGFGGTNGCVEFWDPRDRKRIGMIDAAAAITRSVDAGLLESLPEVESLAFSSDGLSFVVGSKTGQIVMYDLRRPTPLLIKDHQYGYPIKKLIYHDASHNIVSADSKIVKIWNMRDGAPFTTIESTYDINDVCVNGDSGLIMLANEGVQIQSYYIPEMGPAPRWCPFLDNLTEEFEEGNTTTIYDDYKFVTRKDLANLGLEHLIGSNLLKAYMHGFFVDLRLYEKARAIANPFEFEEHKRRIVQQKIEDQRKSRITAIKKLPKINRNLAAKLVLDTANRDDSDYDGEEGDTWDNGQRSKDGSKNKKKRAKDALARGMANGALATSENPLGDDRFAALFQDSEFQVDEESHEYRLHYPTLAAAAMSKARKFDRILEEEASDEDARKSAGGDMSDPDGNASDSSASDDDAIRFARFDKKGVKVSERILDGKIGRKAGRTEGDSTDKGKQGPAFYELKDGFNAKDVSRHDNGPRNGRGRHSGNDQNVQKMAFGERVQLGEHDSGEKIERNVAGNMSITFRPGHRKPYQRSDGDADRGRREDRGGSEKRGVRDLGFSREGGRGGGRGGGSWSWRWSWRWSWSWRW